MNLYRVMDVGNSDLGITSSVKAAMQIKLKSTFN